MPGRREPYKRGAWQRRGRQDHFNDAEYAIIAQGFTDKTPTRVIAQRLGCTQRVIQAHYQRLRGVRPIPQPVKVAPPRPKSDRPLNNPSRFYRSNFEV
jgi:hypothetical protein